MFVEFVNELPHADFGGKEEKTTIFSHSKENLRLEVLLKTGNLIQLNTSVAVNQNIARIRI